MRANGLSDFPDPVQGPGGIGLPLGIGANGSLTADGHLFSGPALKTAEKACAVYLPPPGGPPKLTAAQLRQALAFAQCMRTHGVPNFPDPGNAEPGSGGSTQKVLPFNPQAPAAAAAAKACGIHGGGNLVVGP